MRWQAVRRRSTERAPAVLAQTPPTVAGIIRRRDAGCLEGRAASSSGFEQGMQHESRMSYRTVRCCLLDSQLPPCLAHQPFGSACNQYDMTSNRNIAGLILQHCLGLVL